MKRCNLTRAVVYIVLASLLATDAAAQRVGHKEIRSFIGAALPRGKQQSIYDDSWTVGIQGALELNRHVHAVGSLGWVLSSDNYGLSSDIANIFQYDLGMEAGFRRPVGGGWLMGPFAGAGVGARTYFHEATELTTRTCFEGYGSGGIELQLRRTAWRLEARNYVFGYRSPLTDDTRAVRNEVVLAFTIAYHVR